MQFEKIRRINKSKMIIGGVIALGVIGAITVLPSYAKYRITDSINIANGTVNYKVPDFKVMAMYQQNSSGNYEEVTTMPESGYIINEEKTYCTTDNVNQVKGKIKTVNGIHGFTNLNKGDKCYLYFDKEKKVAETILAGITVKETTPTFSSTATTDEGVYKVSDGMYGGTSYYWRGAVTNNYVKFAGFCWRIVRINGDGSIRLIYDGTTCHANGTNTEESIAISNIAYNLSYNQSNYVGWTYTGTSQRTLSGTSSNAKTQLESWYSSAIIGTNTDKVALGKYCNDREAQDGFTWKISSAFWYATHNRIYITKQPTLSCLLGDTYTLNVGLISADEVMYAGGLNAKNSTYYLYNGQNYWTMSPSSFNSDAEAMVYYVYRDGQIGGISVLDINFGVIGDDGASASDNPGIRPVINLKSEIKFKAGTTGTLDNPYEVL